MISELSTGESLKMKYPEVFQISEEFQTNDQIFTIAVFSKTVYNSTKWNKFYPVRNINSKCVPLIFFIKPLNTCVPNLFELFFLSVELYSLPI